MLERRAFMGMLAGGLVASPISAEAQQTGKVARIGYLSLGTATTNAGFLKAFLDGLREHGWIDGQNVAIDYRWEGEGKTGIDAVASELVRLPLDAIFAVNSRTAVATKRTGTTLPVVFAQVSEPVALGLVDSLSRPGRNFTGLTTINRELMSKRLEVLKEALPRLSRVGYLANPGYEVHKPQLVEMEAAARSLGLTLHLAEARGASEIEGAFARMAAAHVGAFIVQQDDLFVANRTLIIESALQRRLPSMYVFSVYPRAGGFMSYGANPEDLYRRAAGYIDRVLKGTKPSALPVERPTKFELFVNLKTARALGLTVPPALLARADEVIE